MVLIREAASSGVRCKLGEVLRVCEDGDGDVPTTFAEVIELACESIEVKRNSAILSDWNLDKEVALVDVRATASTMCSQHEAAELQVAAHKTQLVDTKLELENLFAELFQVETIHRAQVVAVEDLLTAEMARVEHFVRKCAAKA